MMLRGSTGICSPVGGKGTGNERITQPNEGMVSVRGACIFPCVAP